MFIHSFSLLWCPWFVWVKCDQSICFTWNWWLKCDLIALKMQPCSFPWNVSKTNSKTGLSGRNRQHGPAAQFHNLTCEILPVCLWVGDTDEQHSGSNVIAPFAILFFSALFSLLRLGVWHCHFVFVLGLTCVSINEHKWAPWAYIRAAGFESKQTNEQKSKHVNATLAHIKKAQRPSF